MKLKLFRFFTCIRFHRPDRLPPILSSHIKYFVENAKVALEEMYVTEALATLVCTVVDSSGVTTTEKSFCVNFNSVTEETEQKYPLQKHHGQQRATMQLQQHRKISAVGHTENQSKHEEMLFRSLSFKTEICRVD